MRIVKGDKGTAGTMVAPAGEFKPRTSPKVRFEFAMNIYTEPAASATETATDSTAPQAQSWRDTLPIHPAAELFPRMSEAELAALGKDIRKHGLTSSIAVWSDGKSPKQLLDGRSRLDAIEIEIGPAIVGPPSVMAGKEFLAVNKVIVLDRSVDPYAFVISANIHRPHVETRTDSKGRKQPARKTTTKPPPPSNEVLQQRAGAAERTRALMSRPKPAHDDIGADSGGEIKRLRERNEELENENARLRRENLALRSEIDELRARLPTVSPPADDGLEVPEFLRRTAP